MMNNSLMRRHAVVISILRITPFYIYFSLIYNLTTFFSRFTADYCTWACCKICQQILLLLNACQPTARLILRFYCWLLTISILKNPATSLTADYITISLLQNYPEVVVLITEFYFHLLKTLAEVFTICCKHWQKCLESAVNTGRSV